MSRLDALPADQKAVLQLLLKQGKTYDELANLLRLHSSAVRDRALDALDGLGPDGAGDLEPERQDEVSDYLLGQQSASQRAGTRDFLEGSAAGRAWARVVAGELRPLAGDALPEIPAEGAEVDEAFDALEARRVARDRQDQSSKIGGVLVLIAVGIVVALVVVLLASGGSDKKKDSSTTAATPTTATTTTAAGDPNALPALQQVNLNPVQKGSKSLGVAQIVNNNGQFALAFAVQGLAASPYYSVWLYNSPTDFRFVGFPKVGKSGKTSAQAPLPADTPKFKSIVVTRLKAGYAKVPAPGNAKVKIPARPGTIVLGGLIKRKAA